MVRGIRSRGIAIYRKGSRHPAFTHDRTAFDALFKVATTAGEHGFGAVEGQQRGRWPARRRKGGYGNG